MNLPIRTIKGISFPWGGGGNHIVAMLSLDKTFDICYRQLNVKAPNIENKLKYLRENNYSAQRSWFNWLQIEWEHRPIFNNQIQILHEYYDWTRLYDKNKYKVLPADKIIFLEYENLDLLLDNYWYINLGLNSCVPFKLKQQILDWQQQLSNIKLKNYEQCLFLNGELLFQQQLNEGLYNQICEWFGLEKFYTEANLVHQWWQECKVRSAKEFCQWFRSEEFQAYLLRLENGSLELK